jgi:hypothetical protein
MLLEGTSVLKERSMLTISGGMQPDRLSIPHLLDAYATTLDQRGYRPAVIQAYRRAVEHFLSWLATDAGEISDTSVCGFSRKAIIDFTPKRSPISGESDQRFHLTAIAVFTGFRSTDRRR